MKMVLSLLQEMDDELHMFNEHNMNTLEEELMKVVSSVPCDSDFANSSSSNNGSCLERNTQHANSNSEKNLVVSSCNLSFEDSTVMSNVPDKSFHEKPLKGRSSSLSQQHIMAERKRREKISTMLVELSAMVPGLKKVTSNPFYFSSTYRFSYVFYFLFIFDADKKMSKYYYNLFIFVICFMNLL